MKTCKKWIALLLSLVLVVTLFAGCTDPANKPEETKGTTPPAANNDKETTAPTEDEGDGTGYVVPEEPVVISIYTIADKPERWDDVYAKYLEMTKDTLNIELDMHWYGWVEYCEKLPLEVSSGADIDLCFEATFVGLEQLSAEGYYADLDEYFCNPEQYPGLASAFSKEIMESNSWNGYMNYIPLYNTLGNIPMMYYRRDLAREWGIGEDGKITSMDEMVAFWDAAKANGIIPTAATGTGDGWFTTLTQEYNSYASLASPTGGKSTAQSGLRNIQVAGLNIWCYIQDNQLVSYAVEGSGDENFKDFPEGWQYDFGADRYDTFQQWNEAGYLTEDLWNTSAANEFELGRSASTPGSSKSWANVKAMEATIGEGAEVDFFIVDDATRNGEAGVMPTTLRAGNGLCVPATSTKIPYVMKFLDWMFGSKEAHDLMAFGIEGEDFEYGEAEGTITKLTDYSSVFYEFCFTQSPKYTYYGTDMSEEILAVNNYLLQEDSYVALPGGAFAVDQSDIDFSTAIAQCKAVTDMAYASKMIGVPTDGNGDTYATCSEMLKANVDKAMENGGQEVVDEVVRQLEAYLAGE